MQCGGMTGLQRGHNGTDGDVSMNVESFRAESADEKARAGKTKAPLHRCDEKLIKELNWRFL